MAHRTYEESVSTVWRTTLILSIVTVVEVTGAIMYPDDLPRIILTVFVIVMSLLKAFYIVGVFMHLRFEIPNLILTVLFPLTFLIWFIISFLWEGSWYGQAKETGLLDWLYQSIQLLITVGFDFNCIYGKATSCQLLAVCPEVSLLYFRARLFLLLHKMSFRIHPGKNPNILCFADGWMRNLFYNLTCIEKDLSYFIQRYRSNIKSYLLIVVVIVTFRIRDDILHENNL